MSKTILVMFVILFTSACGIQSSSNPNSSENDNKDQAQKKIQPGNSLTFNCPDSFHNTVVKLIANWNANASQWLVSLTEQNVAGNQVLRIDNLIGAPDATEVLYMNISDNSVLYAKLSQSGSDQALYNDGRRNLQCTFN